MAKMDEITLKSILRAERAAAMGDSAQSSSTSDLARQRTLAMDYYQGDMTDDMPSLEGRSSAVSTDVADTVDGILPSLMDIFMGTDEVCRFDPVGPEDEEAANQETDYVNHVLNHDNQGFIVLHSMMKDALIQKNGIVKYWWEKGEKEERETYLNLTEDAFALLAADEQVEIIEHTERAAYPDFPEPGAQAQAEMIPATLHDATVIKRKPYGCVKVVPVPPEEFLIAKDARDIQNARYCAHKVKRTRSQLIQQGYPKATVDGLPSGTSSPNQEAESRATVNDNEESNPDVNRAMQEIEVFEEYLRVDYDGDGIAELRKVTTAGPGLTILDNEPYDRMPFAAITPQLMSHRFWGRSVADLVMDIQKIKTALIRAVLDNAYFINNARVEIAESHTTDHTIDDLLTNRPGGIVRTKMPGGLAPIVTAPVAQHIFPVIEYFDQTREQRTGAQRQGQGVDADALNPLANTATGAVMMLSTAQQKIRMIARTFAETGIKDLMLGVHEIILKHGTEARQVKLRNKWVTVNPRTWKTRQDMTVMVGLGTGTRDQIVAYLTNILRIQIEALQLQGGPSGPIVTLANVYNTLKKLTEATGFRSADPFFTEPDPNWQPPERPDPKMEEVKGKLALKEAEMQGDQAQAEQKIQTDAAIERMRLVVEQAMERQRAAQDMALERYKAELKAQTDLMIGRMEAQVALMRPDREVREGGSPGR